MRNGIKFNENGIAGEGGIAFVQLHAIGRKAQRIVGWASMVKAQEYALNYGDFILTQELITYRPDKKINQDDHIDAYGYAPQMLQNFMHLIMQEYDDVSQMSIEGSYKLCSD